MTVRFRILLLTAALAALAAAPASAWKGALEGQVVPIAHAHEYAESGDRFVIEAGVVKQKGDHLFLVRDESGEIYVFISDSLQRAHGVPYKHEKIRVAGRYHPKERPDKDHTGIIAQDMERLGRAPARQGSPDPHGAAAAPAPKPAADAPAASGPAASIRAPSTSAEWKDRLGSRRRELLAAEKERDEASAAFVRALREADEPGDVDPAVTTRLSEAEERVTKIRNSLPRLIEEARQDGVSPELLDFYVRATKPKH